MSKNKTSLPAIAERLLEKNPELATIVEDNPEASYKALAPRISARLCTSIGKTEGQFIKRNELIWACINHVQGEEADLEY